MQHHALGEPPVQVEDLVTHYGPRKVLDGVSLTIEPGEIHVIMGTSGSGKSTLLRHMLGLHRPTAGRVRILGHELHRLKRRQLYDLRKGIGVAFQGGALLSSLSVGENIRLPLRVHTRLDEQTMRIMTRMKLELVGMGDTDEMMPSQLSGGMLKRAGLARAVIMDPHLLFFDEPSAGLDPITSAGLDELIRELHQALGLTIVVVTHELESAFRIADRITVLAAGRVLASGSVEQIRASDDPHVQDLLNRRHREQTVDGDAYIDRLTGSDGR